MEIKMNKIPLMAAVALVLGTPLAFAADSGLPSPALATTEHCSRLETQFPIKDDATSYSAAKKQAAEQNAMSLCRQDKHKNGGVAKADTDSRPASASGTRS